MGHDVMAILRSGRLVSAHATPLFQSQQQIELETTGQENIRESCTEVYTDNNLALLKGEAVEVEVVGHGWFGNGLPPFQNGLKKENM